MATDYPIEITDPDGSVRIAGLADFTDPDNQPGLVAVPPFHAAPTGSTPIMVDSPDGDPVIDFDADAGKIDVFYDTDMGANSLVNLGGVALNAAGPGLVALGTAAFGTDETSDLGFYGMSPIAQPVVPLTTPLPQDIIDALVALGLVSQSD